MGHYINITPLSKVKNRNKIIYPKATTYYFIIPKFKKKPSPGYTSADIPSETIPNTSET